MHKMLGLISSNDNKSLTISIFSFSTARYKTVLLIKNKNIMK